MAEISPAGLAAALEELGAIDNLLSRVHSYASLRRVGRRDQRGEPRPVRRGRAGRRRGDEPAAVLRAGVARAGRRPRGRAGRRARGGGATATTSRRSAASGRTRCPSPRSACWPSATRPPSAPGRRCSARPPRPSRCRSTRGDGERAAHQSTGCWPTCTTPAATSGRRALETLYEALEPQTPVLAHCYDSLVGDRLVLDRLRGYDGADGADPPAQRARAGRRRGDAGRRRAQLRDRPALVPRQGRRCSVSPSSSCTTSTPRSARRGRWTTTRPARSSARRSPGSPGGRATVAEELFARSPDRRRAARRQARRRLLLARRRATPTRT